MDEIKFPKEETILIEAPAPGIEGLRLLFVNVFGVKHSDGLWTLVDAGLPFSAGPIHKWADRNFGTPPNAIVLTHGHFDHASAAGQLADAWDVNVYAHFLEMPYLNGEREYPPPNVTAGGGLMSLLSPLLPTGPLNLGDRLRELPNGTSASELREMPGWQIIPTPGHTPGHISLYRPMDGVLLPGDAFCTTKAESFFQSSLAQSPELHGPPAYFTSDWSLARQSVQVLAKLNPSVVAPGHGRPLSGPHVPTQLRQLAARFEEIAVPENRRSTSA